MTCWTTTASGSDDTTTHQEYWGGRYAEHDHPWSGAGEVAQ
ncbi:MULTISPECIES: hypothetical protein [Actinomadura]|nr:hypothetical protein [Actinomadura madurae]